MQDLPRRKSNAAPSLFEKDFSLLKSKLKVPGDFDMSQYDLSQVKVFSFFMVLKIVDPACILISGNVQRGIICNWTSDAVQTAFPSVSRAP